MKKENLVWHDRKRIWCGLPWTFTQYGLSEDRLFVEHGFFNVKGYEVRLYRVLNVNISRSLIQRLFGLGTVHLDSTDRDLNCFDIVNIKNSENVKELISESIEKERLRNRVSSREYMTDGEHDEDAKGDGLPEDVE
ncbi:MAG: PH domain-containing protein [Lachnospiraceae bacterium]|jgi:uncharacterized membrane protein YdbT with pleckstrin-like domain|nr:PH domain-containing protein [Lachnospiraceae bacterium]